MKILVLDGVSEKGVEILREPGFEVVVDNEKHTEEELVKIIPEYHAVVVRSATKITAPVIEAAKNLIVIGRAGVGVDNIDVEAATRHGILVVNAPDGNTIAAAEHTMALMLALARNIPQANEKLKAGQWLRKEFMGVELRGKTLGVIGLGRIGTAVAKRALAFEMRVLGYDPYVSEEKARSIGVELVSLDEIYRQADFITVHLPLTKETKYLINKEAFAKMKKGVRIINVARGGVISEKDLYDAIKEGIVKGAAIDVFETEPTTESPLFELDNVIVTPHLGASTREAQINVALDVAREIVNVLQGGMAMNAVNMPAIPQELMKTLRPYLQLGEKLGKFVAQIAPEVETVEISYSGEIAQLETAPISTAVLKGLLTPLVEDSVNYVNAGVLARSRGIKVTEKKTETAEDYANLITVRVASERCKCEHSVAGTIFRENDARIVMVDGYRVDAVPEGYMIVAPHIDKPRIIGRVGTLIGNEDVNIASMQVGRKEVGGRAVMLLGIDAPVSEETLKEIAKVDGILDVKMVSL